MKKTTNNNTGAPQLSILDRFLKRWVLLYILFSVLYLCYGIVIDLNAAQTGVVVDLGFCFNSIMRRLILLELSFIVAAVFVLSVSIIRFVVDRKNKVVRQSRKRILYNSIVWVVSAFVVRIIAIVISSTMSLGIDGPLNSGQVPNVNLEDVLQQQ